MSDRRPEDHAAVVRTIHENIVPVENSRVILVADDSWHAGQLVQALVDYWRDVRGVETRARRANGEERVTTPWDGVYRVVTTEDQMRGLSASSVFIVRTVTSSSMIQCAVGCTMAHKFGEVMEISRDGRALTSHVFERARQKAVQAR